MKRYMLEVAYDGTNYCGWQIQPNGITIEEVLNYHLSKLLKEDIQVIEETAKCLKETEILCYTGHCTGEEPYEIMKGIMGEKLQYIHCGDVIEL